MTKLLSTIMALALFSASTVWAKNDSSVSSPKCHATALAFNYEDGQMTVSSAEFNAAEKRSDTSTMNQVIARMEKHVTVMRELYNYMAANCPEFK